MSKRQRLLHRKKLEDAATGWKLEVASRRLRRQSHLGDVELLKHVDNNTQELRVCLIQREQCMRFQDPIHNPILPPVINILLTINGNLLQKEFCWGKPGYVKLRALNDLTWLEVWQFC
jgi:hypothetical protein